MSRPFALNMMRGLKSRLSVGNKLQRSAVEPLDMGTFTTRLVASCDTRTTAEQAFENDFYWGSSSYQSSGQPATGMEQNLVVRHLLRDIQEADSLGSLTNLIKRTIELGSADCLHALTFRLAMMGLDADESCVLAVESLNTIPWEKLPPMICWTPHQMADVLWSLASLAVLMKQREEGHNGLITSHLSVQLESWAEVVDLDEAELKDVASILWSLGIITRLSPSPLTAACRNLVVKLSTRAVKCLEGPQLSATSLSPKVLADISTGLSHLGVASPVVGRLLDALAHHVYSQLSNKHSGNTTFTALCVVRLVQSYAELKYREAAVPRMLDAVAGYTARRIRAQHLHALARPDDVVALLHALADLGHVTVATRELLSAISLQVCREVLSAHLLRHEDPTAWQLSSSYHFTPPRVCGILSGFIRLGYLPGGALLECLTIALEPHLHNRLQHSRAELTHPTHQGPHGAINSEVGLSGLRVAEVGSQQLDQPERRSLLPKEPTVNLPPHVSLQTAPGHQATETLSLEPGVPLSPHHKVVPLLLSCFATARYPPPEAVLSSLWDLMEEDLTRYTTQQLVRALYCSATVGFLPATTTIDHVSDRAALEEEEEGLEAEDVCKMMFTLVVSQRLTLPHFGWLLVRFRQMKHSRLSRDGFAMLACCQLYLGEEARELAEEILPPGVFRRSWQALGEGGGPTGENEAHRQQSMALLQSTLSSLGLPSDVQVLFPEWNMPCVVVQRGTLEGPSKSRGAKKADELERPVSFTSRPVLSADDKAEGGDQGPSIDSVSATRGATTDSSTEPEHHHLCPGRGDPPGHAMAQGVSPTEQSGSAAYTVSSVGSGPPWILNVCTPGECSSVEPLRPLGPALLRQVMYNRVLPHADVVHILPDDDMEVRTGRNPRWLKGMLAGTCLY